jgi:two-component system NtrC family sensor kinase
MDDKVSILCVDDEANVLRALERLFIDDDGYEIHTAASGEEGLAVLQRVAPVQLVISDYRMPVMNGVDFLREVCKRWPDTVRIVLSGYADTAAIVSAINEGEIYKFIPKPWNDDELKVTINNALERYFLHKKNVELLAQLKAKNEELELINSNLERIVVDRTATLLLQNRILGTAQNILDALPVAVFGLDLEGLIVQCNQKVLEFYHREKTDILGKNRRELFSAEVNALIERVCDGQPFSERLLIEGVQLRVRGSCLKNKDQRGIILVFDRENDHV